jgi:diguanylate cyclase (GGDEF)-like protein
MTTDSGHDASRETEQVLLLTRIGSVFASTPAAATCSWLGAAVVAAAYWQEGVQTGLILWLASLALIACLRIAAAIAFRRGVPKRWTPARWAATASILNGLLGVACGIACYWLTDIGEQYQLLVLCCFVMAIAVGSFSSIAYWPAHAAMYVPIFVLIAAGFLRMARPEGVYLALGTMLLCSLVGYMARSLGHRVVLSMRLSIENQFLVDRLRGHLLALEQANLELAELSATDPLTGLANRRRLGAWLDVEWQRSLHANRSMGLMIIDIDHFKAYNDRHGHTAGDDCLQLVSDVLRRHVRHGIDLSARYAGDEFAVVLPGADLALAEVIAGRIRSGVIALHAAIPGVLREVTVSIGIAATVPRCRSTARDLIAAADAALYEAKRDGRNRVQTARLAA